MTYGQKKFSKVTPEDFKTPAEAVDTSVAAVCIYDIGNSNFRATSSHFFIDTEVKVRMHILTERGREYANKSISYYSSSKKSHDDNEHVTNVSAASYNLVDGKVVKTSMSGKYEFDEQVDDNVRRHKFTIPEVKVGSIIEYKYIVTSPRSTEIPTWVMQRDIPVRYSYYALTMPQWYNINLEGHGYTSVKYNKKNTTVTLATANNTDMVKAWTYEIEAENLRAFKHENHAFCPSDYIQRMDFELIGLTIPGQLYKSYTQTWDNVREYFTENYAYQQHLKMKNPYAADMASLQLDGKTAVQKASRLFAFLKSKLKWDESYRIVSKDPWKAVKSGKGSNADLNFIYMAMLRDAGIKASPMFISFRTDGRLPMTHVSIDKLNTFVVAFQGDDGSLIFADCSSDYGDINILPVNLMSEGVLYDTSLKAGSPSQPTRGEIYDLSNIMGNTMKVVANAVVQPDGTIIGQRMATRSGVNAMLYKTAYSEKEDSLSFIADKEKHMDCKLTTFKVKNGEGIGRITEERVRFSKELMTDGDRIYVNPIIFPDVTTNPFTSTERVLPIEFATINNDDISVSIVLPEGYEIEEMPKDIVIQLDNYLAASIKFELKDRNLVTKYNMQTGTTFIPAENYERLRDFWSELVKMNNMMISIKKK